MILSAYILVAHIPSSDSRGGADKEALLLLGVVVTQHLERHADTLDAGLVVGLSRLPGRLLLSADRVRLLLRLRDRPELLLERRDLLREIRDLRRCLVDLGGEILDFRLLVFLLGLLLLELLDHLLDEPLNL